MRAALSSSLRKASSLLAPGRAAAPAPTACGAAARRTQACTAPPSARTFAASAATVLVPAAALAAAAAQRARPLTTAASGNGASAMAVAVLGGGCFWCVEACYQQLKGVSEAISGYAGGHVDKPSYEAVCGKKTGHIEVVKVTFDPAVISYKEILEIFFTIHDPTTPDRQGNDVGPQYASAVFYTDDEQVMADISQQGLWPAPIVTKLLPLAKDGPAQFWRAEDYHMDYYNRNPGNGYCGFVVAPKVAKFRAKWATKLIK